MSATAYQNMLISAVKNGLITHRRASIMFRKYCENQLTNSEK